MALKDKYAKLIEYAQSSGVQNLEVVEHNNVLYVSGNATVPVKDRIWAIYDEIDPDMRSADMVLKIDATLGGGQEIYEVQPGDSLSKIAKKYEGMTWNKIFEANKDQIKNPDLIHPGQKLVIPL